MKFVLQKKLTYGCLQLLCLILFLSGCTYLSRFEPNTMVKNFKVEGDFSAVEGHELTIIMQAREIGNKVGVDNYRLILEFKSNNAIHTSTDSLALPIPRVAALKITAEGDDRFQLDLQKEGLDYRELDVPPQIFRDHYFEYFNTDSVNVPDEIRQIKIEATVELFDRRSLEKRSETSIAATLNKSQSVEWYNPNKIKVRNAREELESYRGSNGTD